MRALATDFYARPVLDVAAALIGCTVDHDGCAGVIVETEAYHESEPACHAFVGLTPRTETLFGEPGRAYVYRSYGIHALLNAVCEPAGVGAAVLIRALLPLAGIEQMRMRRWARLAGAERNGGRTSALARARDEDLCSGPGKLTQALGIDLAENGSSLSSGPIRIGPRGRGWRDPQLVCARRVGITRAAELPWRFCAAGEQHVSRPRPAAQAPRARGARG